MKKNALIAVVIVFMIGAALYQNFVSANDNAEDSVEVAAKPGFRAPEFELTGLDGSVYRLGDRANKPTLINFWASWCGPCHIEAPDLQKLYEKYAGKIDLYAVNVTSLDTRKGAQSFVDEYGLTFPIPMDLNGDVTSKKYGVDGYPTSFLIDRDGIVVDAVFGIINFDDLERKIDKLLKE